MRWACLIVVALTASACSKAADDDSNAQMPRALPQGLAVDEARRDPNGLIPLAEMERITAKQPAQRGGLWVVVIEKRSGPSAQPVTTAETSCLSDERLRASRKITPSTLGACTLARLAWSGGTLSIRQTCPSPTNEPTEILATAHVTAEKTETSIVAQEADGKARFVKIRATRVGDCLN
jgi:hypothetical protein